jgi:hypothetical protein
MQEKGREIGGWERERERQTDRQKSNAEEIYSTQNILYYYWFTAAVLKLGVATLIRVAKSFLRVAKIYQDFLTNLNFKDLPS